MPSWRVWPAPAPPASKFRAHLFVHELADLRNAPCGSTQLTVQVDWRGSHAGAGGLRLNPTRKSCTRKEPLAGAVSWDEDFDHLCRLRADRNGGFKSWMLYLEIHEFGLRSSTSGLVVGKTQIDLAPYAKDKGKSLSIPIYCDINGIGSRAYLIVTLEFFEMKKKESTYWPLSRATSSKFLWKGNSQSSLSPFRQKGVDVESDGSSSNFFSSSNTADADLSSQKESRLDSSYLGVEGKEKKKKSLWQRSYSFFIERENKLQPSLSRLLSRNKGGVSFKAASHSKHVSVVNDSYNGGHDHDVAHASGDNRVDRTNSLRIMLQKEEIPPEEIHGCDERFEVGMWERKNVVSRDGQMELVTEVFFASIDQCSDKAAGEGACAVLVAVISDWLHRNRKTLPLRCQFDELIREGSSEWRELCIKYSNTQRFSDQHFDLETVLEAEVRPLSVVTGMSYIGFFSLENMPVELEFLQETMSFDSIWEDIQCPDTYQDRIYITSWNDHFFILKVESEAIYLIDTLGERLHEGCNQAYILKFNRDSTIYRLERQQDVQTEESTEQKETAELTESTTGVITSRQILCEGVATCKEYIKSFLAAVPLRELEDDIEKVMMDNAHLHRRLQIEFHYTAPVVM